jgi:hypothetical protein
MTRPVWNRRDLTKTAAKFIGAAQSFASEKGAAVRLIDRDPPGSGAGFGNAGVVPPFSPPSRRDRPGEPAAGQLLVERTMGCKRAATRWNLAHQRNPLFFWSIPPMANTS